MNTIVKCKTKITCRSNRCACARLMFTFGNDPPKYCCCICWCWGFLVGLKTEKKSIFSCATDMSTTHNKTNKKKYLLIKKIKNTSSMETSFIICSKARVPSSCFWLCKAIFSANFLGFAILEE